MSATTEALELVKLLKPKIGEQAATKLVDYADKQRDKSIDRLWLAFGILAACFIGGYWGLSDKIDSIRQELKADIQKLDVGISENRKLLIQLIQRK